MSLATRRILCARVGEVSVLCQADSSFDIFAVMSEQTTCGVSLATRRMLCIRVGERYLSHAEMTVTSMSLLLRAIR